MPRYQQVTDDPTTYKLVVPSTIPRRPDGTPEDIDRSKPLDPELGIITVPGKLTNAAMERIREVAYHIETDIRSGEQKEIASPVALWGALLRAALLDPRTTTNLTDMNDRPINITEEWIDTAIQPRDAILMGQELSTLMGEQLNLVSADPNKQQTKPTDEHSGNSNGMPSTNRSLEAVS